MTESDIDVLSHRVIEEILEFADETQEDEHTTQPTYKDAILRGGWLVVSRILCEEFLTKDVYTPTPLQGTITPK